MTKKQLMEKLTCLHERIADLEKTIAECRKNGEAMQTSEGRYRRLFESARDGILILDADTGQISDINPRLIEMLGFSRDELLGKRLWELCPLKSLESFRPIFEELSCRPHVYREDLPLETKDGRQLEVEFIGTIYLVNTERVIQCNIRDLIHHRKAEEKLKYLSTHDELTGLHNRMYFVEEMSRLGRGRQFPITVMIADVDGLKQINDRLGHAAGDKLLKRAATVLKETFRADEVVARIGGDEFVVMLPKTDATTAQLALDRARCKLLAHNATHIEPQLSFSLGAATASTAQSLVEALKVADEHMYEEKAAHKLRGMTRTPRDLDLIFRQIDAKLTARPGIQMSDLEFELACERHLIERAVKVVKSMQFREYQQLRRLEYALHLLAEKSLLIKEIAGAIGYTSPTSLWRLLKTRTGIGPKNTRMLNTRSATPGALDND